MAKPLIGGIALLIVPAAFAQAPASGAGAIPNEVGSTFEISPVAMTSKENSKNSIGARFSLGFSDAKSRAIERDFPVAEYIYQTRWSAELSGTVTESSESNPINLIELEVDGGGRFDTGDSSHIYVAGFGLAESDQKIDNYHLMYGIKGVLQSSRNILDWKDDLVVSLGIGRVDPFEDIERKTALAEDPDKYTRADFEVNWQINLEGKGLSGFRLSDFEVNYRYYHEIDPPSAIEDANLDTFKILTYRLGINQDWSIAYSSGELPFSLRDDRVFTLGYTYNFE